MERDQAGSSGVQVVTRQELYNKMQQQNLPSFELKLEYIQTYLLTSDHHSEDQIKEIKHNFSYLKTQFKQRWLAAHKKPAVFEKTNKEWLQKTFELPKGVQRTGRPIKSFENSSERTKRRKTAELRNIDEEILTHATRIKLQSSGKRDASRILKEITNSPKRAGKYRLAYSNAQKAVKKQLTPIQALSMFVEADLSRRQYEIIRGTNKQFYPCYSVLQKAKKECYPPKSSYRVTATTAEINLQDLLNHTVTRLLTYLGELLNCVSEEERDTLELICKWGCDGSRQEQFKQIIDSESDDANIFQSSLVPVRLICGKSGEKTLWQNPTPSSPRYCRPIKISFVKETAQTTNEEINYVDNATKSLQQTKVILGEKTFSVKHAMLLTMVDAKVCNAATQTTSTLRCYICGALSKDFNDLTLKQNVKPESLRFGLSVLHARIRIFESILHLAYKLPVKKWQIRTQNEKDIVKGRKIEIQKKFRQETGLIVDVPKAGFGNTNDGNTSRRFFNDPKLPAEITGIDFDLIFRFKVILQVLSSGHEINIEKFAKYGYETANLYVSLYAWHPMTPTMHKILIHSADVINHALLPIGQLSEEAAEARNKHFRQYRQNFARKFSRESGNLDIINRLLLTSDPLITSIRPPPKKITEPFLKESLEMLLPAEPLQEKTDSNTEESSDEEYVSSDEESSHSSSS